MADLLADFLTKKHVAVPHIIGRGILPVGSKLFLGGVPKSNKSFLVLNIGLDLARGQHVFGARYKSGAPVLPVSQACSVLYLENEIGEHSLQVRLLHLVGDAAIQGLPFSIKSRDTGMRLDTPEGREHIEVEIAQVRPKVLILDPWAKFQLSDENSAQEMGACLRVIDHFIEDYGVTVIVLHHAGHFNPMAPRRGGDKLRGSTAIFGDADSVVLVERKSAASAAEPVLQLDIEIRHGAPIEPLFVKRLKNGQVVWLGENYEWRSGNERRPHYKDL